MIFSGHRGSGVKGAGRCKLKMYGSHIHLFLMQLEWDCVCCIIVQCQELSCDRGLAWYLCPQSSERRVETAGLRETVFTRRAWPRAGQGGPGSSWKESNISRGSWIKIISREKQIISTLWQINNDVLCSLSETDGRWTSGEEQRQGAFAVAVEAAVVLK